MATAWYVTKNLLEFCLTVPETIDRKRREELSKSIIEVIERKKKWYGFLVHVPTEAEVFTEIKMNPLGYYWWAYYRDRDDEAKVNKIIALCKTTDSKTVNLNDEEASMLRRFGMQDGDGQYYNLEDDDGAHV